MTTRCDWAKSELEQAYHDQEWGKPVHEDHKLFEMLVLESMQAGLSWSTILKKRATMHAAFDQFDYHKIALYDEVKIEQLLTDPGIIRNRLKVTAMINNAQRFMAIQETYGSFDHFIWDLVDQQVIDNQWQTITEIPAATELSDRIAKELKKAGFKFLGTTSVYAFLQAIGIVNDHLVSCDFK